jgi:DNA-binding NarL/FixJ family response regulator
MSEEPIWSAKVESTRSAQRPVATIRLLLIEECRLIRDALVRLLRDSGWTRAVLAAAAYEEAALACIAEPPDAVLVVLGRADHERELHDLHNHLPGVPVLAIGVGPSDEDFLACARAGVSGFLDRAADLPALRDAVEHVLNGEAACTPRMTAALLRRVASTRTTDDDVHLTPREREVLVLIERGWTNKQIATHLGIELRTVKNHVHHLLDKLQVRRRGEAAARLREAQVPPTEALLGRPERSSPRLSRRIT